MITDAEIAAMVERLKKLAAVIRDESDPWWPSWAQFADEAADMFIKQATDLRAARERNDQLHRIERMVRAIYDNVPCRPSPDSGP